MVQLLPFRWDRFSIRRGLARLAEAVTARVRAKRRDDVVV